ncbi:zinc dependent phospholipase C family protein [Dongia sp.]|uniref:zinc dependent phospholipase C family protein n=1 Tax=Dongia sp. TaxID=1977262 RepID=UPI0035B2A177
MAGGFAHITAAAEALGRLRDVRGFTQDQKRLLRQLQPLVEVGSVAPDYPYLGGQSEWADLMHYRLTGEVIRNLVRHIRVNLDANDGQHCCAWALGYTAHVATDLTIHPVVERIVGTYAEHKNEHRTCEMHQDAFVWARRGIGDVGLADYFRVAIGHCSSEEGAMLASLSAMWGDALHKTFPKEFAQNAPEIGSWNRGFRRIIDAVDDVGSLFSFTRHLLAGGGLAYPAADALDKKFLIGVPTPEGAMDYKLVFERAVSSILQLWSQVGVALNAKTEGEVEEILAGIPDGNLDTGRRLSDGKLIFWEGM